MQLISKFNYLYQSTNNTGLKYSNIYKILLAMQMHFLQHKNSLIQYTIWGHGPKCLLCLHGFGQDGSSFNFLEKELASQFTCIAIDIPFHGNTQWQEGINIHPAEFWEVLATIAAKHHPTNFIQDPVSILAYSLGGRLALHLLQLYPTQIKQLVLLAPDGLKVNFWYRLGTQTQWGNALFKYTMQYPNWFIAIVTVGRKTGILNKSITKFVHAHMDDPTIRTQLYQRWTALRHFAPKQKKIKQLIQQYQIPVNILYGSYDRIIVPKRSKYLQQQNNLVSITIIEGGHDLLKPRFATAIGALFSQ
ncbi:alpha/beta fold hydrolase [Limnovirga soli]|uniref:Alpha/beta fold hydrolase n=1 Tax=Limnovirga soli TaxID=2656915 RepID=A0A8J8FJY2_9BACT|nr:alpha/beta hydrolase [Limnovirga soli]NNV57704.1 alpha/beta fold hydrolase [Limnovirga soli]